jgi:large subunit ribosomal protein L33
MARNKKVEKIRLRSKGLNTKGKPTGFYYTTTKNRVNSPEKLVLKKFDPLAVHPETGKRGMHVEFEETKIK